MKTPKIVAAEVTPADIHQGVRASCSNCPVAIAALRALHRILPQAKFVSVLAWSAEGLPPVSLRAFDGGNAAVAEYVADSTVRDWIRRFDNGADRVTFQPFGFTMRRRDTMEATA